MNETAIEVLILTINALGAGILLFVSGVAQKIMNEMEPLEFKKFLNKLDSHAMSDPFAVTIATIPIFVVIFYFVMFGFHHWWFTVGIVLWLIGSSITKVTNMPVYKWVGDPDNTDPEQLRKKRHTLQMGNNSRAWVTLLSIAVMTCQFSVVWTLITIATLSILAYPAVWLGRKYTPSAARH